VKICNEIRGILTIDQQVMAKICLANTSDRLFKFDFVYFSAKMKSQVKRKFADDRDEKVSHQPRLK
jgi:hypothetical protein